MSEKLNLIIITGPQGSGKTTLATALQPLLHPYVQIIDGDATPDERLKMAQHGGIICAQSDAAARALLKNITKSVNDGRHLAITFVTLESAP